MPQEFYYPISGATHDLPTGMDDWTNNGGANKNASSRPGGGRSGPMTHDDDTSYISEGTNSEDQAINIDWPGPMGSWDGVLTAAMRRGINDGGGGADASTTRFRFANAAGATSSVDIQNLGPTFAYTNYGPADVSNGTNYRPGGGTWSPVDFDDEASTFFWCDISGLVNDTVKITSFWGEISYTPPSGGFAFLLSLASIAPILTTIDQLEKLVTWRRLYHSRHTKFFPGELEKAWADIMAYKWPTFHYA